jgi:hypothetical protein
VVPELTDEQAAQIDMPDYTEQGFLGELRKLSQGRCDPELTSILVGDSFPVIRWLHSRVRPHRRLASRPGGTAGADPWECWPPSPGSCWGRCGCR